MIVNADAKALEVYGVAYLSRDSVLMQELLNGIDIHSANQEAFGLPSRLIAKILKFRLVYGGNEYSFANDPDFTSVSSSKTYWKKVIGQYYDKYKGINKWHAKIIADVVQTGQLQTPTGRIFKFESRTNQFGEKEWPVTTIKNYPVQSLGADLMSIVRVSFAKRFRDAAIKGVLVNTIHDSIVVDVEKSEIDKVCKLFHGAFNDAPANFERIFKVPFDLPLLCEVSVGENMKDLTEIS